MQKYCLNCNQYVTPVRHIGIGTLLIILFTVFSWIFVVPFYPKRCPMCKGLNFKEDKQALSNQPAAQMSAEMKAKSDRQMYAMKFILGAGFALLIIIVVVLRIVNG